MSDCETNSDDSKDSNAGPVPQFLVVNNINNISMLNGDHILYEEIIDDGKYITSEMVTRVINWNVDDVILLWTSFKHQYLKKSRNQGHRPVYAWTVKKKNYSKESANNFQIHFVIEK